MFRRGGRRFTATTCASPQGCGGDQAELARVAHRWGTGTQRPTPPPVVYGRGTWGTAFGDMGDARSAWFSRTRGNSMPLRELSIVDQREEFVRLALAPGVNQRELCRRFGISRSKGYKWLERYAAEGRAGLADRSRRPHRSPTRTAEAVECEVLRIREESNK